METALLVLILCLAVAGVALMFRERAARIADLKEMLDAERAEKREWANRALNKAGQPMLGIENKRSEKNPDKVDITPRVVTRQQMEARTHDPSNNNSQAPSIHANSVTPTFIDRAKAVYES